MHASAGDTLVCPCLKSRGHNHSYTDLIHMLLLLSICFPLATIHWERTPTPARRTRIDQNPDAVSPTGRQTLRAFRLFFSVLSPLTCFRSDGVEDVNPPHSAPEAYPGERRPSDSLNTLQRDYLRMTMRETRWCAIPCPQLE
ncbi:hypothetical protein PLICRDRAFT_586211 [Plicaturopsis crispa FD-325 SS-3]|nr:hypothetical protein PLICRDRAFT_586211 [Plicaturopsis crispa FD-325 SS-3]